MQASTEVGFGLIAILAAAAYRTGALDDRGIAASIVIGSLVLLLGGVYPFLALVAFVVVGVAATRYRFSEKVRMGSSKGYEKTRSAGNVLGNGLGVLLFLVIEMLTRRDVFWAATFSAIATVNGDTLASELGKVLGKRPRLITNLKPVRPGTNGGITIQGELAALLGVGMIIPFALPLTSHWFQVAIAVGLGGLIGVNADSLIGATLENKGITDNNTTNLMASVIGGLTGGLTFFLLGG